jgi:hypothetical protein
MSASFQRTTGCDSQRAMPMGLSRFFGRKPTAFLFIAIGFSVEVNAATLPPSTWPSLRIGCEKLLQLFAPTFEHNRCERNVFFLARKHPEAKVVLIFRPEPRDGRFRESLPFAFYRGHSGLVRLFHWHVVLRVGESVIDPAVDPEQMKSHPDFVKVGAQEGVLANAYFNFVLNPRAQNVPKIFYNGGPKSEAQQYETWDQALDETSIIELSARDYVRTFYWRFLVHLKDFDIAGVADLFAAARPISLRQYLAR